MKITLPIKFLLGLFLTMLAIVGCDSKEAKEDDTQEKLMVEQEELEKRREQLQREQQELEEKGEKDPAKEKELKQREEALRKEEAELRKKKEKEELRKKQEEAAEKLRKKQEEEAEKLRKKQEEEEKLRKKQEEEEEKLRKKEAELLGEAERLIDTMSLEDLRTAAGVLFVGKNDIRTATDDQQAKKLVKEAMSNDLRQEKLQSYRETVKGLERNVQALVDYAIKILETRGSQVTE